jgi:outer membrane autotransporter protein
MRSIDLARRPTTLGRTASAAALYCLAASGAWAQTNLDYSPVQLPTATAVRTVCGSFVANPPAGGANDSGTPEQRLFSSCRKMVHTANELLDNGGPTAFSLGLTSDEVGDAFQAIAPVQMNAQKQMTAEAARNNALFSRLLDLRGGVRGFSLSLNGLDLSPVAVAHASALPAAPPAARGGGASTDAALGERWGAFVNVAHNWCDVSRTSLQDAYDFENTSLVAGVDYRLAPDMVAGVAGSYQDTKSDYDGKLGSVKAKTVSVAAYGTYYQESLYVDALVSFGRVDYDTARRISIPSNTGVAPIDALATASPEGDQWSAVVGAGYNMARDDLTITPFARLGYLRVRNKAFEENEPVAGLGLAVKARTIDSLQSALGLRMQKAISTSFGVVVPYGSVQWNHEFKSNQSSITSKYVNDPFNIFFTIPTEDAGTNYGVVSVGVSGQFAGGVAAFVQYGTTFALKNVSHHSLTAGVRFPF